MYTESVQQNDWKTLVVQALAGTNTERFKVAQTALHHPLHLCLPALGAGKTADVMTEAHLPCQLALAHSLWTVHAWPSSEHHPWQNPAQRLCSTQCNATILAVSVLNAGKLLP